MHMRKTLTRGKGDRRHSGEGLCARLFLNAETPPRTAHVHSWLARASSASARAPIAAAALAIAIVIEIVDLCLHARLLSLHMRLQN